MYETHSHHGAQLHKLAAAREKIQPRHTGGCCWAADILTVTQPELLKLFFNVSDLSSPLSAFHLIDSFCHLSEVTLRASFMVMLLHNA